MCKLVEDGNFFSASFRAQNAAADQSHNRRPLEKVDNTWLLGHYMAYGLWHISGRIIGTNLNIL
jgi:hypothetical protein